MQYLVLFSDVLVDLGKSYVPGPIFRYKLPKYCGATSNFLYETILVTINGELPFSMD